MDREAALEELEMSEMSMASETDSEKVREMLSSREVLAMIPLDRAALFRLENEGLFPQGHPVSPRKRLWFRDEIVAWQRDLANPDSKLSKAVRLKLQKTKE